MSAISAGGAEDCWFLDVQVPRKVFNNGRGKRRLALSWFGFMVRALPLLLYIEMLKRIKAEGSLPVPRLPLDHLMV